MAARRCWCCNGDKNVALEHWLLLLVVVVDVWNSDVLLLENNVHKGMIKIALWILVDLICTLWRLALWDNWHNIAPIQQFIQFIFI